MTGLTLLTTLTVSTVLLASLLPKSLPVLVSVAGARRKAR